MLNSKDCTTEVLGTGVTECLADVGYPKGVILTQKSWSEDASTTIDKDYIVTKVQEGVFIPLVDSTGFEQNTPEATTQEFPDGTMVVVRNGKPQFSFNYVRSIQFQKIAASLSSYKKYNAILVFDNDVLFLANNGTNVSGFSLGMFNTNTYTINSGSEVGYTTISMQMLDNKQFNEGSVLDPSFDVTNDLNGVIDTVIEGTAASGSDVLVSVKASVNQAVNILGLTDTNFRLIVNGTAEAASAVSFNDVSNQYEITPTSTLSGSDTVVVELYDSVASLNVTKLGDQLYKGKSAEIVVTA